MSKSNFIDYPANTYSVSELAAMYKVNRNKMKAMIKDVKGIIAYRKKKFRRLYFPQEVEKIFETYGTPKHEVNN